MTRIFQAGALKLSSAGQWPLRIGCICKSHSKKSLFQSFDSKNCFTHSVFSQKIVFKHLLMSSKMLFQCTEVNSKVKNVQKYHKSSVLYFIVPVAPTTVHNTRGRGFNSQRIHGKCMGENSHYGYTYM